MGEDVCMQCRSLREEAYWANFKVTQFYQVLSSGFDKQLEIPKSFSNHLKKLPETVTLIGPSGKAWSVGLRTNERAVFFRRGWEEFVKENFLQEKDILIFKYIGDSHFDVQVFDGQSLCEKAASYYVRKCGHGEYDGGFQRKRKNRESSSKVGLTSPQDGNGDTSPEKSPTNCMDSSRRKTTIAQAVTRKMRGKIKFTPAHLNPSATDEEIEIKPDVAHILSAQNVVHGMPCVTGTELATERGLRNTLQLARTALSNEGFMVVMKTSHVIRKFNLSIPSKWISKHLSSKEEQDIILRIQDKKWTTRFHYRKARNSGWIGWRCFVKDNDLQECDVCVFEPASQINNSVALHVHIYRAV